MMVMSHPDHSDHFFPASPAKLVLIAMLIIMVLPAFGQTSVISEDVTAMREETDFGMNRKHFRHFFSGIHMVAGGNGSTGADIVYGRSWRFEFGHRYKRKFSETFSAGYEFLLSRDAFYIAQETGKLIPDTSLHDREKFVVLTVGGSVYQRVNIGRRGNHMGRYLDVGGYAGYLFHTRLVRFDTSDGEKIRERRTGLSYPANFVYGPFVRIGSGRLSVKFSYRASDLFEASAELPELPRMHIGMEFGMHP